MSAECSIHGCDLKHDLSCAECDLERQLAEANAQLATVREALVTALADNFSAERERDEANTALAEAQQRIYALEYGGPPPTVQALRDRDAALAEAVKGLTAISLYNHAPKSAAVFAHDTLTRIDALKVQPEVVK